MAHTGNRLLWGKELTKVVIYMRNFILKLLVSVLITGCKLFAGDWISEQKVQDSLRAVFWEQQGYTFNYHYLTAWEMDQKVKNIECAKYWRNQGYSFDPDYMTAWEMDQKVKNIERAKYWKQFGYNFDPDIISAWLMDYEVKNKSSISTTKGESNYNTHQTDSTSTSSFRPPQAENGDYYNVDNDGDGRVEPVHVRGYYRKDGTYVRSHYRASPGKK